MRRVALILALICGASSANAQAIGGGNGNAYSPNSGVAGRVITKCSLNANSASFSCFQNGTQIAGNFVCPAPTGPLLSVEIQSSVANLGLGLNGQTLNTSAQGTAAGSPDMIIPTASGYYLPPVMATNAITAYSANPAFVTCIQILRQ